MAKRSMAITGGKPFWQSTGLWGSIAAVAGVVLPMFGIGTSAAEIQQVADSAANAVNAVLTFGGLAMSIYGRITAEKKLTLATSSASSILLAVVLTSSATVGNVIPRSEPSPTVKNLIAPAGQGGSARYSGFMTAI